MRRLALLLSTLATGFVVALPAAARTVPLNWNESLKRNGRPLMTFAVSNVTFAGGGWTVGASFSNRTAATVRIPRKRFGLRIFRGARVTTATPYRHLPAGTFQPAVPATLAPGQAWTGTFAGRGTPARGRYVRVTFGYFSRIAPRQPSPWVWLTDHTFRY